jgi:hypothetical protein
MPEVTWHGASNRHREGDARVQSAHQCCRPAATAESHHDDLLIPEHLRSVVNGAHNRLDEETENGDALRLPGGKPTMVAWNIRNLVDLQHERESAQ